MIILYPSLKAKALRGLSVVNVVMWITCSTFGVVIPLRYTNFGQGIEYNDIGGLDFIFAGVWAGLCYGVCGLVGICCSYTRKKSQLIAVAVFSILSLIGAIASACIAGIIGFRIIKTRLDSDGMCVPPIEYESADDDCVVWFSLEFGLMAFSIISGIINLTVLIVVLLGICGLERSNGLVRMSEVEPFSQLRRPSA